jgi:hypothetical protein
MNGELAVSNSTITVNFRIDDAATVQALHDYIKSNSIHQQVVVLNFQLLHIEEPADNNEIETAHITELQSEVQRLRKTLEWIVGMATVDVRHIKEFALNALEKK